MTKSTITREPITHDLKIYPEFFSAVCAGVKRAELRKNDRDYRVGDTLHLMETPRGSCHQTGEFINVKITHITDVDEWMPGYVLLSIEREALHSESVILYRERNPYNGLTTGWQELTENELSFLKENAGENAEFVTLYRHAQSAPVVPVIPPEMTACQAYDLLMKKGGVMSPVDAAVFAWSACRAAMLQAEPVTTANKLGNSPVIPDTWIPVSERMPIPGVDVLVAKEFFGPGDWRRKVGHVRHEDSGWNIYGGSWSPTHWMPLPAAPQEVNSWSSHYLPVTRGDAVGCPFNREVKGE